MSCWHGGNQLLWPAFAAAASRGWSLLSLVVAQNGGKPHLRAHQMGGFDADKAAANFNVSNDHECIAMIAVDKQADAEALPEKFAAIETAPRKRKPLTNNFFAGSWNTPLGE